MTQPDREDETKTLTFQVASAAADEVHRLLMFLFATNTIDQQAYATFKRRCRERDASHAITDAYDERARNAFRGDKP